MLVLAAFYQTQGINVEGFRQLVFDPSQRLLSQACNACQAGAEHIGNCRRKATQERDCRSDSIVSCVHR